MLLSVRRRFIFIHIYKVAGISISTALRRYAHDPGSRAVRLRAKLRTWLGRPYPSYMTNSFPVHISARRLQQQLPAEVFQQYFKFAFVRNPWDWQVSLYNYIRSQPDHYQHALIRSLSGFPEYLQWRVTCDKHPQKDFLADDLGRLLVDYVGRYDRLGEDFTRVCRTLGIKAALPWLNQSPHEDYRTYYDLHTRKLVEEHFREDIETFGFTFDS